MRSTRGCTRGGGSSSKWVLSNFLGPVECLDPEDRTVGSGICIRSVSTSHSLSVCRCYPRPFSPSSPLYSPHPVRSTYSPPLSVPSHTEDPGVSSSSILVSNPLLLVDYIWSSGPKLSVKTVNDHVVRPPRTVVSRKDFLVLEGRSTP